MGGRPGGIAFQTGTAVSAKVLRRERDLGLLEEQTACVAIAK